MKSIKSPFYNQQTSTLFNNLWLPTSNSFHQLKSTILRGFSKKNNITSKVYLNNHAYKKYAKKLRNRFPLNYMDGNMIASRKIRIFPDSEYIKRFNISIGANRYMYNKTVAAINETYSKSKKHFDKLKKNGCIFLDKTKKQCCIDIHDRYFCLKHRKSKLDYGLSLSLKYWRNIVMCKNDNLPLNEKWLAGATYDSRQLSIKNLLANIKSAISNLKNGNIKHFKINFRSKKARNQFFFLDSRELRDDGVLWPRHFNKPLKMRKGEKKWFDEYMASHSKKKFKDEKQDKNHERSDMIITREFPGRYYLHIPYVKEKSKKVPTRNIIAIDPGVRTLHTFYSPDGVCGKIGDNLSHTIKKLCNKIDKLQSKIEETKGKKKRKRKRRQLRRRCGKTRSKIKNIIDDFHKKIASYYCKNYKTIIIPKLNTKSLQKKLSTNGTAGSIMIRNMMNLSHCRLVERIKCKSREYENQVFVVEESYTSVTCGRCGDLHTSLKSNKVFKCKSCKLECDRDINGARNILIRALSCL